MDPSYRVWRRKDKMAPRSSLHGLKGGGTQETQRRKRQLVWGKNQLAFWDALEFLGTARGVSEGTSTEMAMRVKTWGT